MLAGQEQDKLVEKISNIHVAYIGTISGNEESGIKELKKIFYQLSDSGALDYPFEKDIPYLKINVLDYLCRNYRYIKTDEVDSLAKYNEHLRKVAKDVKSSKFIILVHSTNAHLSILAKQYEKAQKYIDSAMFFKKNKNDLGALLETQAQVYFGQKKYRAGIELVEGYVNAIENPEKIWIKEEIKFLAKSYKMIGNYERSNFYFEWFVRSNDNFGKIMDSVARNINKKEAADFKKELDALQVENKSQSSLLNYFVWIGLPILLLLLLAFFRSQMLKKKKDKQFLALLNQIEETPEPLGRPASVNKKIPLVKEETKTSILEALAVLEGQRFFLEKKLQRI